MRRFHRPAGAAALLCLMALESFSHQQPASVPSFVIYKYQHIVGQETDRCQNSAAGTECRAHFQLDFTGSSISLDADVQLAPDFQPLQYTAKGQNSTRSFVDVAVRVGGPLAEVREREESRSVP